MNNKTATLFAALSIAVLILALGYPGFGQSQQEPQVFEGMLETVDADASTITALSVDGQTMVFQYTSETEVVGEADDVQGLTGRTGTPLRITYQGESNAAMATVIEVLPNP